VKDVIPGRKAHLRLGRQGEAFTCRIYRRRGYEILARNWRCRYGELDIVARDGGVLVFAEVKTLRRSREYRPADNLSPKQLARDLRAAAAYRDMFASAMFPWRFELVEVVRKTMFSISIRRTVLRHS
jgi:putative endonuclease